MADNVFVFKYVLTHILIQVHLAAIVLNHVSRSPLILLLIIACLARFPTFGVNFHLNQIAASIDESKIGLVLSAVIMGYPSPIPARAVGAYALGVCQDLENTMTEQISAII
ncbi:hypothetical protein EV702DRAFT_260079 [Suillus placidus]|uniref:Uncharacterized protein n=1 Tax=Suillus placidus TaxID=48579 RepID=A0A9P7D7U6_9AGAM|nr:hypothetical protein EV702DRAFT_260079 [Suillus placidus]